MKFELEPYHRNVTKEAIIADIGAVAHGLGKKTLTQEEYNQHGKYSPSLARQRFGSWLQAIAAAGLSCQRKNTKISADKLIPDLKRVAELLGKSAVTKQDYKDHGKYGPALLVRHFGGWLKALKAAGLKKTREYGVTNEEYYKNLEDIWVKLGRQPYYREIKKPFSKYSAGAYERRFGSWRNALESFVSFVNNDEQSAENENKSDLQQVHPNEYNSSVQTPKSEDSRQVSWRLRFLVMRRDDFKCRCCGNSPALTPGLILHVDHIHPWSKGGATNLANLQTLCMECNIGKSNLSMTKKKG
jgi:hypothetical protein